MIFTDGDENDRPFGREPVSDAARREMAFTVRQVCIIDAAADSNRSTKSINQMSFDRFDIDFPPVYTFIGGSRTGFGRSHYEP